MKKVGGNPNLAQLVQTLQRQAEAEGKQISKADAESLVQQVKTGQLEGPQLTQRMQELGLGPSVGDTLAQFAQSAAAPQQRSVKPTRAQPRMAQHVSRAQHLGLTNEVAAQLPSLTFKNPDRALPDGRLDRVPLFRQKSADGFEFAALLPASGDKSQVFVERKGGPTNQTRVAGPIDLSQGPRAGLFQYQQAGGAEPQLEATTRAMGEEDTGGPIFKVRADDPIGDATTEAVGEEDGGQVTTRAMGEEDGGGATTMALGEEDGTASTEAVGEEDDGGGIIKVRADDPIDVTTMALGEEDGGFTTEAGGEEDDGGGATTMALGEEDGGFTTEAVGEEDGGTFTTMAIGEEDAGGPE